jgi:hypothetical protein
MVKESSGGRRLQRKLNAIGSKTWAVVSAKAAVISTIMSNRHLISPCNFCLR